IVCQCLNAFRRQSSRNFGSFFLSEIARTTLSSSPGGRLSDSISVTKPCRYFCPRIDSTSCCLLDTMEFQGIADVEAQAGCARRRGVEARQLLQGDIVERAADRG